ncbi:MAG TPA: type II toxin-antitoxin system RelE/ParE family toxin [Phycisphaerae bacterium]|mgnify:CR=1 FL=1|nr:type II toxin-antitoxin system RelE/ParE family toxin [Phycisphaerae bacterium]HRR85395.1 type II toxin-antitoxin system RelE/ParE family toxin [Phycisphaerae bacterium]
MDHEVVWLKAALDDLDDIAEYVAADSPAYASVVVSKMLAQARELAGFPQLGRCVPEWNRPDVRERIVYGYRLIYRIVGDLVIILAVIHGSRRLLDNLQDRPH